MPIRQSHPNQLRATTPRFYPPPISCPLNHQRQNLHRLLLALLLERQKSGHLTNSRWIIRGCPSPSTMDPCRGSQKTRVEKKNRASVNIAALTAGPFLALRAKRAGERVSV